MSTAPRPKRSPFLIPIVFVLGMAAGVGLLFLLADEPAPAPAPGQAGAQGAGAQGAGGEAAQPNTALDPVGGFYRPFELSPQLVEGLLAQTSWGVAARNYQAGNYADAIPSFEQALQDEQMPEHLVQFYLGQSLMAVGKNAAAMEAFKGARAAAEGNLQAETVWYLALVEVRLGEEDAAREKLTAIVAEGGGQAEPARLLLERIDG